MPPMKYALKMSARGARVGVSRFANADEANLQSGIALGLSVIGLLVGLLIFAAVSPSLAGGLNNTTSAFTGYAGVGAIVGIIPIVLVVVLLVAVASFAVHKYKNQ